MIPASTCSIHVIYSHRVGHLDQPGQICWLCWAFLAAGGTMLLEEVSCQYLLCSLVKVEDVNAKQHGVAASVPSSRDVIPGETKAASQKNEHARARISFPATHRQY